MANDANNDQPKIVLSENRYALIGTKQRPVYDSKIIALETPELEYAPH